jgi:hypothetical protein
MNPDQGPIGSIVQTPHTQGHPGEAGAGPSGSGDDEPFSGACFVADKPGIAPDGNCERHATSGCWLPKNSPTMRVCGR